MKMDNGFTVYPQSEEDLKSSVKELEQKLFGLFRESNKQQTLLEKDFIPIKTGTGVKLLKNGPSHILDAEEFEPLYTPQENILEECLRREAERVAHQENVMNRVVYDSVDPAPPNLAKLDLANENEQLNNQELEEDHELINLNPNQCDNDSNPSPYYSLKSPDDYTLIFESRFESGNLRRAIQVYEFEYDIILKPDYNTRGYTQWYYFRIQNARAGRFYRFNIINLLKPDSLYNHGMRPLMYSEIEAKKFGAGWSRSGKDVCYYQNSMKRKTAGHYYTLTFNIQFKNDNDSVYLAHCYPYTYSNLQRYLNKLEGDPSKRMRFKRRMLCQSLAGNNVDLLTVTTFGSDSEQMKQRKGMVISSRVHPGESGASYMMKGIIDYLVGPSLGARILRDNFVFQIIPMLNPDGVIIGNTRCSLAGCDLNRVWMEPSKKLHPTIYHTKTLIKRMQYERDVLLFIDLHGHSRKKNIFMYGNSGKNDKFKERIFPYLLEKQAETFSFNDCAFSVQKSKESTARVVVWRELGISNSYTLESSFCGSDFGKFSDLHFNTDMLQKIGHHFCETIIEYCQPDQKKVKQALEDIEAIINNIAMNAGPIPPGPNQSNIPGGEGTDMAGGTLNENGGALGVIKDEDSNADSDFSGDEGPIAATSQANNQKPSPDTDKQSKTQVLSIQETKNTSKDQQYSKTKGSGKGAAPSTVENKTSDKQSSSTASSSTNTTAKKKKEASKKRKK